MKNTWKSMQNTNVFTIPSNNFLISSFYILKKTQSSNFLRQSQPKYSFAFHFKITWGISATNPFINTSLASKLLTLLALSRINQEMCFINAVMMFFLLNNFSLIGMNSSYLSCEYWDKLTKSKTLKKTMPLKASLS